MNTQNMIIEHSLPNKIKKIQKNTEKYISRVHKSSVTAIFPLENCLKDFKY